MNRTALRIRLSTAIAKTHGVVAQWFTSTQVAEKVKGVGEWRGSVETFELMKHKTAKYCYAWAQDVGEDAEIIMALKVPPINSPQAAVREYLLSRKPAAPKK